MDAVVCRRVGSLKPSAPPSEKDALLAFERNFVVPSLPRAPSSKRASSLLIRVAAASLNFADALQIMGQYQERPPVPFVPGAEVAGVVEEVGEGEGFKRGDRVCAVVGGGGFADLVVTNEGSCFKLPPSVPFPAAAALPVAFGTAHVALAHRACVGRGHVVLVLGAGGGVGVAAVQICKLLGATVIAVARGAEKARLLSSLGADLIIDTAQHTQKDAIREQTRQFLKDRGLPGGVDVLFDAVGGEQFKQGLRVMRWGGHVLIIGFASGAIPSIPANIALVKNLTIHGIYWGSYMQHDPSVLRSSMRQLLSWLAEGAISVHVSHTFGFDQVHQAILTLLKRKAVGKVVLLPPSTAGGAGGGAITGSTGHKSRL
ncbi:hypothetical protein CLOM_g4697 [Closterium sp. NIES-68]|nr:hypothetical protein CLOM_g4697 [Closterium sp. NIES-68]GJP68278.1 hypothetical protein CLOP_g25011 [Closterium sp. NIES-67]